MRRFRWAALVCAAGVLAMAGPASAAPPSNDNFANATTLPSITSVTVTGTNVEATTQAGEPTCCFISSTVWYHWTAPETGSYEVELCASSFNTFLKVVQGTAVNNVVTVAENDDDPGCGAGGTRSRLTFSAVQGELYYLQVGSSGMPGAPTGTISGSIALIPPQPPPTPPPAADTDPPETTISKDVKRSKTGKVKFRFTSDESETTFECKLKGHHLKRKLKQFRGCASPRKYKNLDGGRYKFMVRAIDAAGNVDLTPAKDGFRVLN